MSINRDRLDSILDKKAVTCCRTVENTIISHEHLEDPDLFSELEECRLLSLPENTLTIVEALGRKLTKTVDSLQALTSDLLEEGDISLKISQNKNERESEDNYTECDTSIHYGVLKTSKKIGQKISEKDLESYENIRKLKKSLILDLKNALPYAEVLGKKLNRDLPSLTPIESSHLKKPKEHEKLLGELIRKYYSVPEVVLGEKTEFSDGKLTIDRDFYTKSKEKSSIVKSVKVKVITPEEYSQYSETIMDVQPIAVKEGDFTLGTGVTRVLDGVIIMVTGTDENGVQIGEFGSSEGILSENIGWNRPGSPDKGDIIIKTEVVIASGMNMERPGPLAAHRVTDILTQDIRLHLKKLDEKFFLKEETFQHYRRKGERKVLLVKEIMGQGAMHDNLILPHEPVGIAGAKANIDLGNLPVVLSPLEVLDGAIHALTCIGPASKECSRHYFREPLVIEAMRDEKLDLCGVVFIGSPQINREKFYVSGRLGTMVSSMDIEGAIVTTEGFGNNHIDFANHIEEIGKRGIPVVGMTFSAQQGALVVGNPYMTMMVDLNKTSEGIENEILAYNTLCHEDAVRALEMLKATMEGHKILPPEKKWNAQIKFKNLEKIESLRGEEL
ncbi:MAG: D-proline reductase (dithiol) proprotein PrdA [Fusobacteriaceae bacterium]